MYHVDSDVEGCKCITLITDSEEYAPGEQNIKLRVFKREYIFIVFHSIKPIYTKRDET